MLSAIPLPYRLLAITAALVAAFFYGLITGRDQVQTDWNLAVVRNSLTTSEVKTQQAETTIKVVTEYVDRVKIVRAAGETIIKEIPRYVPPDTCTLPAGFRLLHDAAAGHDPDPAGLADAQPVPAATLAETIAENYTACQLNAEQLTALQAWALKQSQIGAE